MTEPTPFPVRKVGAANWEVLIVPSDLWLSYDSEDDARAIAAAPVLEYEALEKARSGAGFAAELSRTAEALEHYRMGFGSRFFRWRAAKVASDGDTE